MTDGLFSKRFWIQAADRAIKSFAQGMLYVFVAAQADSLVGQPDVLTFNWRSALSGGVFMAIISILTSIVSSSFGDKESPMLLPLPEPPPNQDDGPPEFA